MSKLRPASPSILFVHYRDNFSGAPRVLAQAMQWAQQQGWQVELLSSGEDGFLHRVEGVGFKRLRSGFGHAGPMPGWLSFVLLQIECSGHLVLARLRGVRVVYFNTLYHPLPLLVAAALLFRHRLVHCHEIVRPQWVQRLLDWPLRMAATGVAFVSKFAQNKSGWSGNPRARVVSNGVEDLPDPTSAVFRFAQRRVTMVCAPQAKKGIEPFFGLARLRPDLQFRLALDGAPDGGSTQPAKGLPRNLEILYKETDPVRLYGDSSVVVNLSLPNLVEETFGLTIAEALRWGIPVIVPPVGGPQELIENGVSGILADARDLPALCKALDQILSNQTEYLAFAQAAKRKGQERLLSRFHSDLGQFLPGL